MTSESSLQNIQTSLETMLPPGAVGTVCGPDHETLLYPEEVLAVSGAVASRRSEFARGRACARHALSLLGCAPSPIMVGRGRQPVWPSGFLGSITHCEGLAAAVAAPVDRIVAIGLDAERARPLPAEVRSLILNPSERTSDPESILETVVFSAKECVHKAIYPLHAIWLDFLDVEVRLDPKAKTFRVAAAEGRSRETPGLGTLRGRFDVVERYILAVCSAAAAGESP